ncbi:prostate androgen-regulated mucin 1 [Sigmodon hispidus]
MEVPSSQKNRSALLETRKLPEQNKSALLDSEVGLHQHSTGNSHCVGGNPCTGSWKPKNASLATGATVISVAVCKEPDNMEIFSLVTPPSALAQSYPTRPHCAKILPPEHYHTESWDGAEVRLAPQGTQLTVRHHHFAQRHQTPKQLPKPPGLIAPGGQLHWLLPQPTGRKRSCGCPRYLVSPRKLFPSCVQLGTERRSNMVCKALLALCIFTAGLRVQGASTSAPLPVSLMTKISPPTATWTTSTQNTVMTTTPIASSPQNASVIPTTAASLTSHLPKDISTDPREEAVTSPPLKWNGSNTDSSSPTGFSSTSSNVHLTPTPKEHGLGSPETSVPATSSQSPTLISSHAPTSTSTSQATSSPESPSASGTSNHSSTVTSSQPTGLPMAPTSPTEEYSSSHKPTSHVTAEPTPKEKSPQDAEPGKVICESETTTPFLIMQEVENALSSGSIAAITVTVIAVVLLVFGAAAYLKIRHSSYGRLLDDHDYGSWGNYNNPLYDDS